MKLNKVNIINKGMSQDASISKEVQEYAFENKNIRIQALEDSTLLSITNVKGPKKLTFNNTIQGTIVGKCYTGNYLVLFTVDNQSDYNYIYRVDLNKGISKITINTLYKGRLNFDKKRTFDTLFFYENKNVQKVYWTESWYTEDELAENRYAVNNPPRVINIITEGERNGNSFTQYQNNEFEFYPEIKRIPKFKIQKNYEKLSQLPAGVVQYFVSYYNENASQTLIANSSDLFTIDYFNRGAKVDEFGMCSFDIKLSQLDTTFDYVRVYSAIRTTKDGPLLVKIVGDIKINKQQPDLEYFLCDNGINQETLDDSYIYFVGGQPFYAKTLQDKDGTLFFGNIKTDNVVISEQVKNLFSKQITYTYKVKATKNGEEFELPLYTHNRRDYYTSHAMYGKLTGQSVLADVNINNDLEEQSFIYKGDTIQQYFEQYNIKFDPDNDILSAYSENIEFTINDPNKSCKGITTTPSQFSKYYNYKLQTNSSASSYKTFKGGEMYRFGIQFQTSKGEWTSVAWIGDKECTTYPIFDNQNKQIMINNAVYAFPKSLLKVCQNCGYVNYRIVIADPENQNGRRTQAQGIVCPTLFSPGQRALGTHSISSWIMRPKNFNCASHHFEPITSSIASNNGSELSGYDVGQNGKGEWADVNNPKHYTTPYIGTLKYDNISDIDNTNYELCNSPKYLVTSFGIHSGHKLSIKVTEIKSDFAFNNFNNPLGDDNGYITKDDLKFVKTYNEGAKGWQIIRKELEEVYKDKGWDTKLIPSANAFKKCASKQFWGEFLTISALIAEIIAVLGLAVGAIVGGIAGAALFLIGLSVTPAALPLTTSAAAASSWRKKREKMKPWQLEFHDRGYVREAYLEGEHVFGDNGLLPIEFRFDDYDNKGSMSNCIHFYSIHPLSSLSYITEEIANESKNYYVDESIVTFHSPEIDKCSNKKLQFKIVGTAPIDSTYSDLEVLTSTAPYLKDGGVEQTAVLNYRKVREEDPNLQGLYSDYIYAEATVEENTGDDGVTTVTINPKASLYKMYLWDKQGSIPSIPEDAVDPVTQKEAEQSPSILKSKTIYNQLCSFGTNYIVNSLNSIKYTSPSKIKVFQGDSNYINLENNSDYFYTGNYDYMIIREESCTANKKDGAYDNGYKSNKTIRIKYNSSPHAVFDLHSSSDVSYKKLLPYFEGETQYRGLYNYKDTATHQWNSKVTPYWAEADSCWTYASNIYHSKKLFKLFVISKNASGIFPSSKSEEYKQQILAELNSLTEIEKLDIITNIKQQQSVELGIIKVSMASPFVTSDTKQTLRRRALTSAKEYGGPMPKNGEFDYNIVSGGVAIYYDKQKISKAQYIQDNGLHFTDITLKDSPFNDDVYIIDGNIASGRYKYRADIGLQRYIDFPIKYTQSCINSDILSSPGVPYLFIGELYYDLKPKDLYNGFNTATMDNLVWYPVSPVTPIGEDVKRMTGDTYYQRWDCLKTYPSNEEDVNKVVDITSCMLETHTNLDARIDSNRASFNMMSRPSNFNLFNSVYDSYNNIFQYNIINKDFSTTEYPNQVIWTLTKNYLGDVDTWTECNMASVANCSDEITKLKLFNNKLLAFNTHSIELVNFNNKNMVPSEDGSFIELANSAKIDGTTNIYNTYGTNNMSILITEKGLYFIDDNENCLILLNSEGTVSKISSNKMDSWFKNNINKGTYTWDNSSAYYLEYDPIHKDVYIMNPHTCLIYNELLESFTSFMDYPNCIKLFPVNSSLFSIANNNIYQMFEGRYNTTFDNTPIGYSITYRVNPQPYVDKVFTNVEFIADITDGDDLLSTTPFDTIRVQNEYQDTQTQWLSFARSNPSNLKQKFRIWRVNIPRDGNKLGGNRIRNPWIKMQLAKYPNTGNKYKLELHSMNVQYMM